MPKEYSDETLEWLREQDIGISNLDRPSYLQPTPEKDWTLSRLSGGRAQSGGSILYECRGCAITLELSASLDTEGRKSAFRLKSWFVSSFGNVYCASCNRDRLRANGLSTTAAAAYLGISVAAFKSLCLQSNVLPEGTFNTGWKSLGMKWAYRDVEKLKNSPLLPELLQHEARNQLRRDWKKQKQALGCNCNTMYANRCMCWAEPVTCRCHTKEK